MSRFAKNYGHPMSNKVNNFILPIHRLVATKLFMDSYLIESEYGLRMNELLLNELFTSTIINHSNLLDRTVTGDDLLILLRPRI